jgi:hypothetical protein
MKQRLGSKEEEQNGIKHDEPRPLQGCERKGVFLECSSSKYLKVLRLLTQCLSEGCVMCRSARNLSRRGVLVGHGVYSVLVGGNAVLRPVPTPYF